MSDPLRQAALLAHRCNISIVPPTEDGRKAPGGTPSLNRPGRWKELTTRRTTLDEIDRWYGTNAVPKRSGIGAICGAVSGNLECLEFDALGIAYEAFKAAAVALGLGDLIERIEAGYLERSPSGGMHWFYRCDVVRGSTPLARYESDELNAKGKRIIKPLIETRGEGGYVVTAPSCGNVHPTGKPYVLLRGGFSTIATITPDEQEALWRLARTFDRLPHTDAPKIEKRAQGAVLVAPHGTTHPIDDYNQRAEWSNVLPQGWTLVYTQGGTEYWRRPGKDRGHSATINRDGSGRIYVFSTSTEFEALRPYSKFAAYALIFHAGNFSAALRTTSQLGYGTHASWEKRNGEWTRVVWPNPCPKGRMFIKGDEGPPPEIVWGSKRKAIVDQVRAEKASGGSAEPPPIKPTPIATAMLRDLEDRLVSCHRSGTGAGKSWAIALAAAIRYRKDKCTLIAVPTLRLAKEMIEFLHRIAPDAFEKGAVAEICGRRGRNIDGEDEEEESDGGGSYPIEDYTRIVVATHAQLGRRGFSELLRAIWVKLEGKDDDDKAIAPFSIIIDEVGELIRACEMEFILAHRTTTRMDPDESGGRMVPLTECPKSNRSGNCGNCTLRELGGEARFNRFTIRELTPPKAIEIDSSGNQLRKPRRPLKVKSDEAILTRKLRVGGNTFAATIVNWQGKPVDGTSRKTAPLYLFSSDKGIHPPETPSQILAHMLDFAYKPVVTWDYAINEEGERVSPETLQLRLDFEKKTGNKNGAAPWDDGITFPLGTCDVPRLRFADLACLEKLRRFAVARKVGVVFSGATLVPSNEKILREVWPKFVVRTHSHANKRVKQVAVAFLEDFHGANALVEDGVLVTTPLEEFGCGIVFFRTRKVALAAFQAIKDKSPTVRLAEENDEVQYIRGGLHSVDNTPLRCYVTYSRGVLGLGANIKGIRFLVVDARAFRSIASFTPGEINPDQFERLQAEERGALITQNLGRAMRGEEGKTVVLIVLNADSGLRSMIQSSPAITDGAELLPVLSESEDIGALVDQARRWLAADGGAWPEPDPSKAKVKRPGGRPRRTRASVLDSADAAIEAGMPWREFVRKEHPARVLSDDEITLVRSRFAEAAEEAPQPIQEAQG